MDSSPLDQVIPNWDAKTLQDIDTSNPQVGQRLPGSNRQFVRFYKRTVPEAQALPEFTKINKQGSATVSKRVVVDVEHEFVKIITPGDKNEFDDKACDYHKREHWKAYVAFRDGKTGPIGTDLDECRYVNPSVVLELKYKGCHTQEQLADASDVLCGTIPDGFSLREFARANVKASVAAQPDAKVVVLTNELQSAQSMIAQMQEEMKAMKLAIEAKPRGRPRQNKEAKNETSP